MPLESVVRPVLAAKLGAPRAIQPNWDSVRLTPQFSTRPTMTPSAVKVTGPLGPSQTKAMWCHWPSLMAKNNAERKKDVLDAGQESDVHSGAVHLGHDALRRRWRRRRIRAGNRRRRSPDRT